MHNYSFLKTGTTGPMLGLVTNIKTSGPPLDLFPISDQVSFRYWLGRHNLNRHQLRSIDTDSFLKVDLE
ncbi:hypothetical protein AYI68_g1178 [Smittium mucronatum]|uniref:Uncharacterized protein n=1 Tax=Smittium mucronatum TaxID=133383 RepID=A0A1R0H6D9_9FUNG|nr:hypothetical protein AYI68_g1178 [Smittium mucronatum]